MANQTEAVHNAEFLYSEAPGYRSREKITVVSGAGILLPGTVLGQAQVATPATAAAVAGNTGNGTMGTVTVGAGAKVGVYTLTIIEPATNAGVFVVEDPAGLTVGRGNVASAFSGGGLSFTLADGSTDFASGDQFTITVAAGTLKYNQLNTAGTLGTQNAVAILYGGVDATSADQPATVIARAAEVDAALIVWPAGISTNAKNAAIAQLAAVGIQFR